MSLSTAFAGVVLIWATTPLTIQWSGQGPGFLFGVAARMVIGLLVCLALVALARQPLPRHRGALLTYLAGGLGLWLAMTSVYWGAQRIPSGLISVVFGLTPLATALMAARWLAEPALTRPRLAGLALGLVGLALIFHDSLVLGTAGGTAGGAAGGPGAAAGIAAVLASVLVHSGSAVWIKRIGAGVAPLATTTGSLLVATPLFLLDWALGDGRWPADLPPRALGSILYLAVFGSALGFILYYRVLAGMQASRVALITLITPVLALLLGQWVNGERVGAEVWLGSAVILVGLALFQWGGTWGMGSGQGLSELYARLYSADPHHRRRRPR